MASKAFPVSKKYTVQSTGVWEKIRRAFAVSPDRSNGVPLNPQFRNPPPGALPPTSYDDPVTVPAADIADNPYWKRDVRRNYPKLSVMKQADVAGLLAVGSKAAPKETLGIGTEGTKQLDLIKSEGEEKGLAGYFEKDKSAVKSILKENGLPPMPSGLNVSNKSGEKRYVMDGEQSYEGEYPCRSFT